MSNRVKFVNGRAEKSVESNKSRPKKVYGILETEIAEESKRSTSFGEKGLFQLRAHLLM